MNDFILFFASPGELGGGKLIIVSVKDLAAFTRGVLVAAGLDLCRNSVHKFNPLLYFCPIHAS